MVELEATQAILDSGTTGIVMSEADARAINKAHTTPHLNLKNDWSLASTGFQSMSASKAIP